MRSGWGGTVYLDSSQSEGRGRGDYIIDVNNLLLYIFSICTCDSGIYVLVMQRIFVMVYSRNKTKQIYLLIK